MNHFLGLFDAFLCALVVIAVMDYLRRIRPAEQPLLALSIYMVAIGAFGRLTLLIGGDPASYFDVLIHVGIVAYAWARRHLLFEVEWSGRERRASDRRRTTQR